MDNKKISFKENVKRDFRQNYSLYLMVIPVIAFYVLFCYKPMYGILIAFTDFDVRSGLSGSTFIGLENFRRFFSDPYFLRNIVNTVKISLASIVFGFPAPILLALMMNELNTKYFKRFVQTATYLPHFISLVVVCGMIRNFVSADGLVTTFISGIIGKNIQESLLYMPKLFTSIYVTTDIWQEVGWGSIIYMAALSSVSAELYEAARIDGAGRFRQTISVTIPSILPTVVIMLILRLGGILAVGYEKIMLLINQFNADSAEVLSYYIYKKGLVNNDYGLATAAGLFNSVINLLFVVGANFISKRLTETSLW